jgi:hypothetical protein
MDSAVLGRFALLHRFAGWSNIQFEVDAAIRVGERETKYVSKRRTRHEQHDRN